MNKVLSYILVGGASALIGGFAGFLISKKLLQNKFDEELANAINKEIEAIRNRCDAEETKEDNSENEAVVSADGIDEEVAEESSIPDYETILDIAKDILDKEFPGQTFNEYRVGILAQHLLDCYENGTTSAEDFQNAIDRCLSGFTSPEEDFPDEDENPYDELEDDDEEEPQKVMEEWENKEPYVIPLEEYRNLPSYFEFLTWHYFEEDDVLIDETDSIVDDIDGTVGDALIHFDEEPDDGDCVYVVCGKYGNAIEIVRLHSSYKNWNGWGSYT